MPPIGAAIHHRVGAGQQLGQVWVDRRFMIRAHIIQSLSRLSYPIESTAPAHKLPKTSGSIPAAGCAHPRRVVGIRWEDLGSRQFHLARLRPQQVEQCSISWSSGPGVQVWMPRYFSGQWLISCSSFPTSPAAQWRRRAQGILGTQQLPTVGRQNV